MQFAGVGTGQVSDRTIGLCIVRFGAIGRLSARQAPACDRGKGSWDDLAKSPGGKQWQASSSLHHIASLGLAIISLGRATELWRPPSQNSKPCEVSEQLVWLCSK